MRTTTHFLLTAVLAPRFRQRLADDERAALLAGAVLPDLPLGLLSAGFLLDRNIIRPHLPDKKRCGPAYNALYFYNPWWIAGHNMLHAPLMLLLLLAAGLWLAARGRGPRLLWFVIGCAGHSVVDILTHADDGPLLFFPLDWRRRFHSPLSYWDPRHGGNWFGPLSHLLDLLLLLLLIKRGLSRSGFPI